MMRILERRIALILGVMVFLGGCSVVSGWFPDKQKQYKYSTEIPPLEIPPDLTSSTIDGAAARPRAPQPESNGEAANGGEAAAPQPAEETAPAAAESPEPAAQQPRSEAPATLAQSYDDVPLIEIQAPFEIAWNEVAKALGRLELEVSDQNRSDGVYYVYYGGENKKPYEDRGFFGDVAEMFGAGAEQSKEYRVKLEEKGKVTLVYVLAPDNQPQSSGPGFELLKRLHETLQARTGSGKG